MTVDKSESKPVEAVERRGRAAVVMAMGLIFVGVILLGNVFGALPVEIWRDLVRWWPVLLVFQGLEWMVEDSKLGEYGLVLLMVLFYLILMVMLGIKYGINWL